MQGMSFGASISKNQDACVLLQPASAQQSGTLFIVSDLNKVVRLELTETVVSLHRTSLGLEDPLTKGASANVLNFTFVNEHLRKAINTNSYAITAESRLNLTYTINAVTAQAELSGFVPCNALDLMRVVTRELHRAYDRMHDMTETAESHGIQLEEPEIDIATVERMHQAEARRKNLSAVNPNMRAKTVSKGFSRG